MAYPRQATSTSTSKSKSQTAATGGLLSPELWANPRGAIAFRVSRPKNDTKSPPVTFDFHHAKDPGKELPEELVRLYPDLDNDSRNFLKHGPRSAAEKLAYAQQVNPLAHLDAVLAPQDVQQRFQDTGELEDKGRFFAGPDGRVYLRNDDSDEQLGATIRRGYEQAIGGFDEPTINESLGNISEATRSKRADVELYSPPTLPEQAERERMLAPYHVNPAMWQKGDRAEDYVQETFQESGYLWDAIAPWTYVGPDGVVYYKNELTRLDPYHASRNARDWWETQQYLKTLPPPTADELLWRNTADGGMLPGGRQVVFKNSSGKFLRPGSLEAGVEIRARLADIPRLAALYGWKQAPQPGAPTRYWGGSRGNRETQDQNEAHTVPLVQNASAKRTHGGRDEAGEPLPELYLPNPASDFAELLGLKVVDGRLRSNKVDITLELPNGKLVHIQTADIDPRTGKVKLRELDAAQNIRKRTGDTVLVYPKKAQLDAFLRRREKLEESKNRNLRGRKSKDGGDETGEENGDDRD